MGDTTPVRNIRVDAVLWNAAQQTAREQHESMSDVLRACLRRYVDSHLTEERLVVTRAEPPRQAVDPYSVVVEPDNLSARFTLYQETPSGQWRRQRDLPVLPVADLPYELLRYTQGEHS